VAGGGLAVVSILDNPPHVVMVQLMKRKQNLRGSYDDVPDGEPIAVPCTVQAVREWSSAEEIAVNGLQLLTLTRIFSRTWPGDSRSVTYWDGHEWETIGEPQHFQVSRRTNHWAITVKRRGAVD
jgi:hypothetical protein